MHILVFAILSMRSTISTEYLHITCRYVLYITYITLYEHTLCRKQDRTSYPKINICMRACNTHVTKMLLNNFP